MKRFKSYLLRAISLALALPMLLLLLSGCASDAPEDDGRLKIVSTIFPSYDFARQICGETASVTMLLPPGSESHSYEPTTKDILLIQNCDLFIFTGGESDVWVDKILNALEEKPELLRLMECVEAVEEEHEHGEDEEHEEEHEHEEEEHEYDEHVWTSPKNAVLITKAISEAVIALDGENKSVYEANVSTYLSELEALDGDFTEFLSTVDNKLMIFGDRFPFLYFALSYGIEHYAAFPGCSTETEPSAATLKNLIEKARENKVKAVYYIEFSNHLVADTIAEAANTKIALFHSCHNITPEELASGVTYCSLMRQNLSVLRETMN